VLFPGQIRVTCADIEAATPWTLPSNLALAVGPDIDYAIVLKENVRCCRRRRDVGDRPR